ncbi:hypothetical protein H109_03136 [Trichophyton interdigitale MR816]|uniref:Uncharacterized protein n=1 Tax=Trichophyton interdigitale (strain MR816) TaxID=1215338 RepID=A0A059JC05_TRIIM|nr:hypothetical protein H109_03136 [Trichophyton interdigitale MR816]
MAGLFTEPNMGHPLTAHSLRRRRKDFKQGNDEASSIRLARKRSLCTNTADNLGLGRTGRIPSYLNPNFLGLGSSSRCPNGHKTLRTALSESSFCMVSSIILRPASYVE